MATNESSRNVSSPATSQVVQGGELVVEPKPSKIASEFKSNPNPSTCKEVPGVG